MDAPQENTTPPQGSSQFWAHKLTEEHERLHAQFCQLLLAASFGSLFFLTQFQPLFPKDQRICGWLLDYSWLFSGVAVVSGSFHYGLLVLRPIFAARLNTKMVADLYRTRVPLSDEARGKKIDKYLSRCIVWHIFYWLHLVSFVLLIGYLATFKFYNRG